MADVYVRSGAGGANNGTTKADAYTTLEAAGPASAAGDRLWVASDHAETKAGSLTVTLPGTSANPNWVACVDFSGSTPPVAADLRTTATIATTGSASLNIVGTAYFYGIGTQRNTSAANQQIVLAGGSNDFQYWENCSHTLNSTGSTAKIALGSGNGGQMVVFVNTTVGFGHVGQQLQVHCRLDWLDTPSAITGTVPTTLILPGFSGTCRLVMRGIDLSAAGSGKNLVDMSQSLPGFVQAIDCKTNASVTLTTGSVPAFGCCRAEFVNYGSSTTNYQYYYQDYAGVVTHETTIVKTSPAGASDGATPISRKMVSSANSKWFMPLEIPVYFWSDSTSSQTITFSCVTDNVTLTDADIGLRLSYQGTSGNPLSVAAYDRSASILATGANQTSDSSTWTTTGLTTPVKQQISVTVTPTAKGVQRAYIQLMRPSTTVYVDPKGISSGRQYQVGAGLYINENPANSGGGLIGGGNLSGGFL